MKKYLIMLLLLSLFALNSCKDDVVGGGGVIGGGGITFAMSGQGDINNYTFGFKPSVDTRLSRLIAALPSNNPPFFDTLTNGDPNYVFSKDTIYTLSGYQGVQPTQAWTFTFTGNIVSNNQAFTISANFIVP